jgi:hypothetical protein
VGSGHRRRNQKIKAVSLVYAPLIAPKTDLAQVGCNVTVILTHTDRSTPIRRKRGT